MKIAMLAAWEGCCGTAAYARDLAASLRERAVVAVEPLSEGPKTSEAIREMADHANQADVVHIQHEHALFGGVARGQTDFWALRYAIQKPVVITAHTTAPAAELIRSERCGPTHRLILGARLRSKAFRDSIDIAPFVSGRCITLTETNREALIGRGAQPRFVHTIPPGAPAVPTSLQAGSDLRRGPDLADASIVLQSLRGPAYRTTLQILDEIPSDVVVVLAGLAEDAGAPGEDPGRIPAHPRLRVEHALDAAQIASLVAEAAVVLAGGDTEGGPRDVLEAMACGKPVLAPDLPVYREIQERVPCQRLVRPGDSGHLAACLKAVLSNELGRAEMSERGRRYAERFSWSWVADRTMEVYRAAIADEIAPVGA